MRILPPYSTLPLGRFARRLVALNLRPPARSRLYVHHAPRADRPAWGQGGPSTPGLLLAPGFPREKKIAQPSQMTRDNLSELVYRE